MATESRVDRKIYVEKLSGTYRFRVGVFPLKRVSRTFDAFAEGIAWALAERERLLSEKAGGSTAQAPAPFVSRGSADLASRSDAPTAVPAEVWSHPSKSKTPLASETPAASSFDPDDLRLDVVLKTFQNEIVDALASPSEASARLRNLARWFGYLALRDLTRQTLGTWIAPRLGGEFGAGRGSGYAHPGAPVATKDQRRRARKSGRPIEPLCGAGPAPVSTQTVRHELG